MYKEIELQTAEGEKKAMGFLATGSTAIRYRMAFGRDLMVDLLKLSSGGTDGIDIDTTASDRLAFIMNAQAEKKDMSTLNMDAFLEWADQFDGSALLDHMNDFTGLYFSSRKTTSTSKKGNALQTEK